MAPKENYCLKPQKYSFWDHFDWNMKFRKRMMKNSELIPLIAVTCFAVSLVPLVVWIKNFRMNIDIRFSNKSPPRYEMTTHPGFFDLREPRSLKFVKTYEWQPSIHLDNRYRLMRGEQMLDANGMPTENIGKDETGHVIECPPPK